MHIFACNHLDDHITRLSLGKKQTKFRVLDVGSGSGYLVAAFARLLQERLPEGSDFKVVGVEHIQELVDASKVSLRKDLQGTKLLGNVIVTCGDGYSGHIGEAPYDFIHVGAACNRVPEKLEAQLKVGGVLVLPLSSVMTMGYQSMITFVKNADGSVSELGKGLSVSYVPLTTVHDQLKT
jgi:protein-L-isoaspartate(D-aspartate) O-methyltransferase